MAATMHVKTQIPLFCFLLLLVIKGKTAGNSFDRYGWHFIAFCVFSLASSIIRSNVIDIANVLCVLVAFFFCWLTFKHDIFYEYSAVFYSFLISCVISFIMFSISNTNSKGMIYSLMGIILLNYICLKKNNNVFVYVIVVGLVLTLISITKSRTSLIAFIAVAGISYIYLFMKKITIRNVAVLIIAIITLFIFYDRIGDYFYEMIFNKRSANIDFTAGRVYLWQTTIERAKLFGSGIDFLHMPLSSGLAFDAHNSFFQLLGCLGIFSFIAGLIFTFQTIFKIIKSNHKIIYINFFLGWLVMSMFESLDIFTTRMIPATILFIVHVCLLLNEDKETQNALSE